MSEETTFKALFVEENAVAIDKKRRESTNVLNNIVLYSYANNGLQHLPLMLHFMNKILEIE